jgi:allantoin racemase
MSASDPKLTSVRRGDRLIRVDDDGLNRAGTLDSGGSDEPGARPMRLNIVNPNITAAMTKVIAAAAAKAARPDTIIWAVESAFGPPSIEGAYDDAFAVPGLLDRIRQGEADGADAHVIACFDDTGLDAARALATAPVVGIGEAGFFTAAMLAHRFSVVTTLSRSVSVIENNLLRYGLERRCTRVRAAEVPVLELDNPASDARQKIAHQIARALDEDGAEAVVLGCAGMADLAALLGKEFRVPVIDGVGAAVVLAEGLAAIGLRTSKRGGYARPLAKAYSGAFAPFSPQG